MEITVAGALGGARTVTGVDGTGVDGTDCGAAADAEEEEEKDDGVAGGNGDAPSYPL